MQFMRSHSSDPTKWSSMSEQAPSTLGWVLEDRQLGYEIGRGVGEVVLDLAIMAGGAIMDTISDLFSRPPAAEPPPTAAAIPPQEARQSPPGAQAGPGADEPENGTGAIVGAQSSVPEPLQMVPGRDPAGNEIYAAVRQRPE